MGLVVHNQKAALSWGFPVGRPGLEPGTLGLKVPCSNPMS